MKMTNEEAKRIINEFKDDTFYFDRSLRYKDIYNMFRRDGFGEAETNVILAALILAGAKFQ